MITKSTHYKLCDKNGIILHEGNKADMQRARKSAAPGAFVTQTWKNVHPGDYVGFVPQPITAQDIRDLRKSMKA